MVRSKGRVRFDLGVLTVDHGGVSAEPPSYEELAALVVELRAEVAALRAENAELRARVGKDSSNSSRPPSLDGLAKPAPRSLRGKSGRRPGGQAGHRGQTLCQVANPDRCRRRVPRCCRGCGGGLSGAPEVGVERRQVFDIPPISVKVTEYQLVKRQCGCGTVTTADAPAGVEAPVRRDRGLSVCGAVPAQGPHRQSAGRVVRHPDVGGDGRGDDRAGRRRAR
ncbi:hypothetical protein DMB38_25905 [Streptomyces sp. WAC 06738]|nr:hypothetical protein DMB38_25905 [Streptomyces sp. WAC 06738]